MFDFFRSLFKFTVYYPVKSIFCKFRTKKENIFIMNNYVSKDRNFKIYRVSKERLDHSKNIIYFANHRTFGDFWIDNIVTEYCARFISRDIVKVVLPIYAYLSGYIISDSIQFFRRGKTKITDFENMIKINQNNASGNNVLVYPEGTRRSGLDYACDLKKGLIYYSYKEGSPLQFVITKNKEKILNEKTLSSEKNANIFVYYSKVFYPDYNKYKSMQEYYTFINEEWKLAFNSLYATDHESRKQEYQQLDISKIHDNNYEVNRKMLNFIRLSIIAGIGLPISTFVKILLGRTSIRSRL